jgi:hypothetical protein
VSQSFYLIDYFHELASIGNTFRVANKGTRDSFDFSVRELTPDGSPARWSSTYYETVYYNLLNQQDTLIPSSSSLVNRAIYIVSGSSTIYPNGTIKVDPESKEVKVRLSILDSLIIRKGRMLN